MGNRFEKGSADYWESKKDDAYVHGDDKMYEYAKHNEIFTRTHGGTIIDGVYRDKGVRSTRLHDADDIPNFSGNGPCFITTAVCKTLNKADDCAELTKFRHFRDTFMQTTPEMKAEVEEYYVIAPQICDAIDRTGDMLATEKYTTIWERYLKKAFEALDSDDKQTAHDIYKEMVLSLKDEYAII